MSIFGRIKDAIFGGTAHAEPTPETAPPPPALDTTQAPGQSAPEPEPEPSDGATADVIDVENHLDAMPGADRLNWRTSIVDLMKLIGVPSDYESREALAHELGHADYSGSAADNLWLHKTTMQQLSRNGGKVPAELLD